MKNDIRTEEALKTITDKVEKFQHSSEYIDFLKFVSKCYDYSTNNRILIWSQMPTSSIVNSFKKWKDLGRNVKKGEKGLKILVPIIHNVKEENENGEEVEVRQWTSYKIGHVFDVSQTEGDPIPDITPKDLTGNVEKFDNYVQKLKEVTTAEVIFDEAKDKTEKGYYMPNENKIYVHFNSQAQMLKTLVHEVAHSLMHKETKIDPFQRECEAESVAYIVCDRIGLDTSEYSTKYIAGWKGDGDYIKESLNKILSTADQISKKISEI